MVSDQYSKDHSSQRRVTNCKSSSLAWADIVLSSHCTAAIWARSVSTAWWKRSLWPNVSTRSVNVSIRAERPDSSTSAQRSRQGFCTIQLILKQAALGSDTSHPFLCAGYKGTQGWPAQPETPPSLGELHFSPLPDPHQHKLLSFGEKLPQQREPQMLPQWWSLWGASKEAQEIHPAVPTYAFALTTSLTLVPGKRHKIWDRCLQAHPVTSTLTFIFG